MLPSLALGRTDPGADYRYFNPFKSPFITETEASVVLRGMDRHLLAEHLVCWDFSEIVD